MNITKCFDLLRKRTESLIHSDMPLCQWNISKKGTVISQIQIEELLAYYHRTKFAPLFRINYQSHSIYILVIYGNKTIKTDYHIFNRTSSVSEEIFEEAC